MKKQKKKTATTAPAQLPTKSSFFSRKREYESTLKKQEPSSSMSVFRMPKERLLYEQGTGLPYARVVGDSAVCLETDQEIFRFKSACDDDELLVDTSSYAKTAQRRFDFTPPAGKRHPNDPSVDVHALVQAGLMSQVDVASGRSYSAEELRDLMAKLERAQEEGM